MCLFVKLLWYMFFDELLKYPDFEPNLLLNLSQFNTVGPYLYVSWWFFLANTFLLKFNEKLYQMKSTMFKISYKSN